MTLTTVWNIAQQGELPEVGAKIMTSVGIMPVTKVEPIGNGARYLITCEDGLTPSGTLD